MKKIIYCLTFFISTINNYNAQIVINPYYGAPNSLKTGIELDINYLNEVYSAPTNEETWNKVGPVGLLIKYITKSTNEGGRLIAYGLDLNYSTINYKFNYNSDSLNTDSLNTSTIDTMQSERSVFRAMFRFDLHIGKSERFDPYISIGGGFRNATTSFTSTNPDFIVEKNPLKNYIALRVAAGMNLYFTSNFGVMLEVGFGGGGLGRAGLIYKLNTL
jgi:opacity protein-like surface antigen